MEPENINYKIIAAAALGALGGFLLARYLQGTAHHDKSLSEHLSALSKVLEQIEGSGLDEAEGLKERIENILTTIESTYGSAEE